MKNKKYLLLAATAALFAACSSDDANVAIQEQAPAQQQEVGFDAYLNRGTTRSGAKGTLSTNGANPGEQSLITQGFGVFGYYTDGQPYNETSTPNFMYNQMVSGSSWTYSPAKYWPNEFGSSAISEGEDRLTFFAYAPYVPATPSTGRVEDETYGIIGMTSNTQTGDPYIKYKADFDPDNRVDLCWGVAATAWNSSNIVGGTQTEVPTGFPFKDLLKPTTGKKVNFKFEHALAALNIQIDADIDELSHGTNGYVDNKTKIWVRSVTFEGFTDKGKLNLNSNLSEGPLWYEISSVNNRVGGGSVTVYDGRRDGKEGFVSAEATNEKVKGLNKNIVQSEAYNITDPSVLATTSSLTGVPNDKINLFDANVEEPIYVIPTNDVFRITIVYDVETYDGNLSTYLSDGVVKGSTIENAITKEITLSSTPADNHLKAGLLYKINLHLGMTSVKFDATVTAWGDGGTHDVDLPANKKN